MKKWTMSMLAFAASLQLATAFPTWMGTYGNYKKHDDRSNPGLFSVLMNQDYFGLQAEVGLQVNNGNWVLYPMNYSGNVSGNSYWTFTPSFQFPGGASVKYFFHGKDQAGGHIYDSRNGLNYEFVTSPTVESAVQRLNHGTWYEMTGANGITMTLRHNLWVDFKIRDVGAPEAIGILWTDNNWTNWSTATAVKEADLGNGYQQWGADVLPLGEAYYHRSLGFMSWAPARAPETSVNVSGSVTVKFAIFYKANGTWYWDNNNGADYQAVIK
jgi:hypothetical protein